MIGAMFRRLIDYALKFPGERRPEIRVSAKWNQTEWVISIEDNGAGFEPKYANALFQLFGDLKRDIQGRGLGAGLAICPLIAAAHRGSICAESEPGKGSRVIIRLPQNQRERP
jgi:chemotaxis family two-component system sensor kinase Cph1